MDKPTPEEDRRRKAIIEARLRNIPLLWEDSGRQLYLSADGYYVVHVIVTASLSDYIGISPEGELKDLVGYDLSSNDYDNALSALRSARQYEMERIVRQRYREYRW